MASSAISAQGSKFYQGTGTGGALTITGISKAFKAEVTATHALAVGDRVTFASVVGMTEINGIVATVLDVTGTTKFIVNVDSRAFTSWSSGGTATPIAFTQIRELKDFKPSGASVSKIDRTNLDSQAKEYVAGLVDNGDLTASIQYVSNDPGLIAATTAFTGRLTKQFKLETPNGDTFSFQGFYLKFPTIPSAAVDGLLLGDMSVQIDGVVTKTP